MATQWAPGPLHSKGKIRPFLLQELLFARCSLSGFEEIWKKQEATESTLKSEQ